MSRIIYQDKEALNTNPAIPNFNKVQADDMNIIKNAVNQLGQLFTATTPTTTKFQIESVGELSDGDLFNIKFSDSAGSDAQAELSVDGGQTFFNIENETVSTIKNKTLIIIYEDNRFMVLKLSNYAEPYETGTFAPTVRGSTVAGTANYVVRKGSYTKIGNRVFYDIRIGVDNFSGGSGNIQIADIPYFDKYNADAAGVCPLICSGSWFQGNLIRLLWLGGGLIVSAANNGLGGTAISNIQSAQYLYASGSFEILED